MTGLPIGRLWREPTWLDVATVVEIHDEVIRSQGTTGFPHPGYLESALAAPRNTYLYEKDGGCDLFDLAAVYLYHIAKGHAFSDGNKRTAYVSALVFLAEHGIFLLLPEDVTELAVATVDAADGKIEKSELAVILRQMAVRRFGGPRSNPKRRRRRRRTGRKASLPGKVHAASARKTRSRRKKNRKRLL